MKLPMDYLMYLREAKFLLGSFESRSLAVSLCLIGMLSVSSITSAGAETNTQEQVKNDTNVISSASPPANNPSTTNIVETPSNSTNLPVISPPLVMEAPSTNVVASNLVTEVASTNIVATNIVEKAAEHPAPSTTNQTQQATGDNPIPTLNQSTNIPPVSSTNIISTNIVNEADEVMEVVPIQDAPVDKVVEFLAQLARINIIFDTKLTAPNAEGKIPVMPNISLRVENVTARQVLEAVLKNQGWTMVLDPKTKINQITLRPPPAQEPLISKVYELQYSSPTNIVDVLKSAFPAETRVRVIPDIRTSQLVISAPEAQFEEIFNLIKRLDSPTRQILIEAKLLETAQTPQSVRGIDWSGTLENQKIVFGNGYSSSASSYSTPGSSTVTLPSGRTVSSTSSSASSMDITSVGGTAASAGTTSGSGGTALSGPGGLSLNTSQGFSPNIGFLTADGASAVLSFLNRDSDTEVISTPRTVTLDNQKATLSVTRSYPIFQITPGSASVAGGSQVQYTNLGTILNVTPRISGSNNVALMVEPEVSNVDSKDQQTINGQANVANIYAIRRISTHVMIPSGSTLVMGGLISDTKSKSNIKVPILGDLPLIGLAFRQDSKKRIKQNLLIFITPTILQDSDYQKHAPPNFLRERPPVDDTGPIELGPIDRGKPYDWKKKSSKSSKSNN